MDARAVAIAEPVKADTFHDVRSAISLHARAIDLNLNLPIAWTLSSASKIYNGEYVTAIRHALMPQSLSPRDQHIFVIEHSLMMAYLFCDNLEEAELLSAVVLARSPRHVSTLNIRLAILGYLRRREKAANCLAILQDIEPTISAEMIVARIPRKPKDKHFYIDGLACAGLHC